MELQYAVLWIFLLVFPAISAWRRYWAACSVFVLACIIFISAVQRDHEGWDSLNNEYSTLVVMTSLTVYIILGQV